jgi:hypothetical protein
MNTRHQQKSIVLIYTATAACLGELFAKQMPKKSLLLCIMLTVKILGWRHLSKVLHIELETANK